MLVKLEIWKGTVLMFYTQSNQSSHLGRRGLQQHYQDATTQPQQHLTATSALSTHKCRNHWHAYGKCTAYVASQCGECFQSVTIT